MLTVEHSHFSLKITRFYSFSDEGEEGAKEGDKAKDGKDKKDDKKDDKKKKEEEKRKKEEKKKKELKPKVETIKEPLEFDFRPVDLAEPAEKLVKESKAKLKALSDHDEEKMKRATALNALESFVIDTRDKLYQEIYEDSATGKITILSFEMFYQE